MLTKSDDDAVDFCDDESVSHDNPTSTAELVILFQEGELLQTGARGRAEALNRSQGLNPQAQPFVSM